MIFLTAEKESLPNCKSLYSLHLPYRNFLLMVSKNNKLLYKYAFIVFPIFFFLGMSEVACDLKIIWREDAPPNAGTICKNLKTDKDENAFENYRHNESSLMYCRTYAHFMFEVEVPIESLFTPIKAFARYSIDGGNTFLPGPDPFFETHLTASSNDTSTSIPRLTYAWGLHAPSILNRNDFNKYLPSSISLEIGIWMGNENVFSIDSNKNLYKGKSNEIIKSRSPFTLPVPLYFDDGNEKQEENILISYIENASAATLWCNPLSNNNEELLECRFNMHLVYKLRPKTSILHNIQAGAIYNFPLLTHIQESKHVGTDSKDNIKEDETWQSTDNTFWEHQFSNMTNSINNETSYYQTFQSGVDEKFIVKKNQMDKLVRERQLLLVRSKLWAKIDNNDLYLNFLNPQENEIVWGPKVELKVCIQQLEPFHTPYCPVLHKGTS